MSIKQIIASIIIMLSVGAAVGILLLMIVRIDEWWPVFVSLWPLALLWAVVEIDTSIDD